MAIAAFVLLVLQKVFMVPVDVSTYNLIVTGFLGILVLLGIVNNPSSVSPVAVPFTPKEIATLKALTSIKPVAFETKDDVLPAATKTYDSEFADPGAIKSGRVQPL